MTKSTSETGLTVKDALRLASLDKVFSVALVSHPQVFAKAFNLAPKDVEELSKAFTSRPKDTNYTAS